MRAAAFALALSVMAGPAAADTVRLYAAGSLKAALRDVAAAYARKSGNSVDGKYGPSGLLKNESWHVAEGRADIFLTYCTNALAARQENPGQQIVALPGTLAVGADYGLTVVKGASAAAQGFADFILSADGQAILSAHGFASAK